MIAQYFSLFALITGGVVGVVGAIFTVRSSLIKSNISAQRELLDTVTAQKENAEDERDKFKTDLEAFKQDMARLEGENKTLRDIATQTPEILKLTKEVSHNSKAMGEVVSEITHLTAAIEKRFIGSNKDE